MTWLYQRAAVGLAEGTVPVVMLQRNPRRRPWPLLARTGMAALLTGLLIVAASLWQLWGTGLVEADAQADLSAEFERMLDTAAPTAPPTPTTELPEVPAETPPAVPPPTLGAVGELSAPVARIEIPAIGVDKVVVQGVGRRQLRLGPGHYPNTSMPGQGGNVGIAGHRTTYGAPFNQVDRLQPGDPIVVTTLAGTFRYEVTGQQVVYPSDSWVLRAPAAGEPERLTLTSCHPKGSSRKRIVISAELVSVEDVRAVPTGTTPPTPADPAAEEIAGDEDHDGDEDLAGDDDPTVEAPAPGPQDELDGTAPTELEDASVGADAETGPGMAWAPPIVALLALAWLVGVLNRRFTPWVWAPPVAVAAAAALHWLALVSSGAGLDQLL